MHFFFYYRDIIYNLFQDMCTYSQLKNIKKLRVTSPGIGQWRPLCPKIVRV